MTMIVTVVNTRKYTVRDVNLRVTVPMNAMVITRAKIFPRPKPPVESVAAANPAEQVTNYYWLGMIIPAMAKRTFLLRTWVSDCPSFTGPASVGAMVYVTEPGNDTILCRSTIMPQQVHHVHVGGDRQCTSSPYLPFSP